MTNPNKALAERLHKLMLRPGFQSYEDQQLILASYKALTRLASQREAVIDRGAIVRIIRETFVEDWRDADNARDWKEDVLLTGCRKVGGGRGYEKPEEAAQKLAMEAADAIIRSLPSREAIIEECAKICDLHAEANEIQADKANESGFAATRLAARASALRLVAMRVRSLAAQPCSNSVEGGAGRNPPQKAVIDTEQSGHVLSQELKPHNGRIRNWYKLECDNGLGYYIMGTLLDHPTIPVKHTNTSWIEKHDLATGEIETRNSRYTLLGEELKS